MVAATRSAPPAANEPTTMTIRRGAPVPRTTGTAGRAVLTSRWCETSRVTVASRGNRLPGDRGTLGALAIIVAVGWPSCLLFQPALKHDDVPQQVRPVAATAHMLQPLLAYWSGVQKALASQARFIQQRFGPVPQRSAQPAVDGNAETHLRPIGEGRWHIAAQQLFQQPFSATVMHAQTER